MYCTGLLRTRGQVSVSYSEAIDLPCLLLLYCTSVLLASHLSASTVQNHRLPRLDRQFWYSVTILVLTCQHLDHLRLYIDLGLSSAGVKLGDSVLQAATLNPTGLFCPRQLLVSLCRSEAAWSSMELTPVYLLLARRFLLSVNSCQLMTLLC